MSSVDIDTVLLDAGEIDDMMGTNGSEVLDEGDAPDDVIDADPPQCHGLVYIAGEMEYGSTDFTAMQWRVIGDGDVSGVVEMVAEFPSATTADEFVDTQAQAWKGCVDEVITSTYKEDGSTTQDRVTAVHARPGIVIASTEGASVESSCRHGGHVLQAVSNVVLEVSACADTDSGQAEAIASKLAERVQSG